MPKLKIGIPIDIDYNPLSGGSYSYVKQLIDAIDEYKFNNDIEIVFLNFENKLIKTKKQLITFHPFSSFTTLDFFRKTLILCLRKAPFSLFKNWLTRIEAKHANSRNQKITTALHQNGVKVLFYINPDGNCYDFPFVTIHWDIGHLSTYMFPEFLQDFESRKNYYQQILPKALLIVTETNSGKEELINYMHINPERIEVMPIFPGDVIRANLALDKQHAVLKKFELNPKCFFLYPAQFWAHKNHALLIDAFEIIIKNHPDIQLILTGSDKGNLAYIKDYIIDKKLDQNIKLLGFISNDELFSLYKHATALVMPTFLGPSNMPPLEAAYLNCPVIISDLQGHRELLGAYARYFDPLDATSIAKEMLNEIEQEHHHTFDNQGRFNIQASLVALDQIFMKTARIRKTWA